MNNGNCKLLEKIIINGFDVSFVCVFKTVSKLNCSSIKKVKTELFPNTSKYHLQSLQ